MKDPAEPPEPSVRIFAGISVGPADVQYVFLSQGTYSVRCHS